MPIPIIIAGFLILSSAFSYSMLTTINRDDTESGKTEIAVREIMPDTMAGMMDGENMAMESMSMFADGMYTRELSYEVPYGYLESMEVSLALTDGVITDASVSFVVENPVSADYQNFFQEYYKDEVVGESIETVSLSRMGGASLTNGAFDAALQSIKAEASGQVVPSVERIEPESVRTPESVSDTQGQVYIDGTYVVENTYFVMPGFEEPMQTTVTIADNIIVDAEVRFASRDPHSLIHQRDFSIAYRDEVIGTPLRGASFSRIGRASLTTIGFNDALVEVRNVSAQS